MKYKQLGKTGFEVSKISFGAASLGEEYGSIDTSEGTRAVHCAIDRGINYFDVSPYYGGTLAETRLGEALVGKRDSILLATKVGRYKIEDGEKFDFSAAGIRISLEASLGRLRTDCIDVFQLHDIEFVPRRLILDEALPTLHELKREGKIRAVGVTAYTLHLLHDVALRGDVDTILSYSRYHLMDTSMIEMLGPVVKEKNIGLINASPLGMRLLTDQGPPDWHPAPLRVVDVARQAAEFCRTRGADLSELALQFALGCDQVATTMVGMSKVSNVERNLAVLEKPLDEDLLTEVLKLVSPVANIYWEEGIAENFDPGSVPQKS